MRALCRGLSAAEPRAALAALCNLAYERRLVAALAGNASCRVPGGFLCTPTGCCLGELEPADLVLLGADWRPGDGQRAPSSEWRLHAHVYRAEPGAAAVLHTHSPAATALALAGRDLEPLTPEMAHFLGRVPCLPFVTPGTDALGAGVAEAIGRGARAALLADHGAVAWASTIRGAFHQAELLEAAAALALAGAAR